jgi:hypothetical protein
MKIYDGSSWNEAKDLKIYNPSGVWVPALKGWVFTGSGWVQHYPNFPVNYSSPVVAGSEAVGQIASVSNGSWTLDASYAPSSYSYQWRRDYVNISGATSNQYTLVAADAGKTVNAVVTATNQRGITVQNSANSIIAKPANLTGLSLTDSTSTPSAPTTVSVTGGTNAWSASWTNTGAPAYGVRTNNGSVSYSGGTSATGSSASAGSATVYVKSINTSGLVSVSWAASSGATHYNVNWTGGNNTSVSGTSTTISWPTGSSITVTVTPMVQVGGTAYGGASQQSTITPSQKASGENSGSGTIVDPVYAPSSISYTENGFGGSVFVIPNDTATYVTTGTTLSVTNVSAPGATAPVTYSYAWETNAGSGFNVNGSTGSSYTIGTGYGPAGTAVRCKITASNSAGSTSTYTSSTGGIIHATGTTLQIPTGISMGNDVSPAGGTLYWTDPTFTVGIGSSFSNWSFSPRWGSNIQWYKSSTSGGTYTANGSFITRSTSTSQQSITRSSAGWYYVIMEGYNTSGTAGTTNRFPASGGFQFT